MGKKGTIDKIIPDLNEEISVKDTFIGRYFSKGNIRVIIINEDQSYREYKVKLKNEYFFTLAGKKYLIVSKAFLISGSPMILYYFNNPMPLNLKYENTEVSGIDLRTEEELKKMQEEQKVILGKTFLDGKGLHAAFSSNLLTNFYLENKFTTKHVIIIGIVACVVILVILQLTGTVDVLGQINKLAGGVS